MRMKSMKSTKNTMWTTVMKIFNEILDLDVSKI